MIRLLVVGADAVRRAEAVRRADIEVVAIRLPAAAIRAFEATPADAIVIAGEADYRAAQLVTAFRARPLGGLVPVLVLAEDVIDGADARLDPQANDAALLTAVLQLLVGADPSELLVDEDEVDDPDFDAGAELSALLTRIRRADYFAILEVDRGTSAAEVARSHQTIRRRVEELASDAAALTEPQVIEIIEALDDALLALTHAELRSGYERRCR
jgi:hypothetical protein